MDELEALVAQVPDEVLEYIDDLETRVEKAEAAVAPAVEETEIEKALNELPESLQAVFKAQQEQLDAAQKTLEAERVAKADSEWVAKASGFDRLVDNTEEFGQKLRRVSELDSGLADEIAAALSAASQQVAKSALYSEIGHGTPSAGSADEMVANIAKALVEADPSKSKETAEAEAWEANPELYEQHKAERDAALRGGI
jgi:hypothetical protein